MRGRSAVLAAVLLSASVLAGCTGSGEETPTKAATGSGSPTSTSGATPVPSPTPPTPRGTSERWHFHDYWKNDPTITLYEADVTFNATPVGDDGLPTFSAIVDLPHGVIVPPETGFLTMTASWVDATTPGGLVNITYKPADSNDFFWAGDGDNGVPVVLNTTESNCDVPHRQASAWRFHLTAKPGGEPTPGLPPQTFHFNITATIGRPLFIDPPHLNWWRSGETIPLIVAGNGTIRTAQTPAGNLTAPEPTTLVPAAPELPPPVPPEPPQLLAPEDLTSAYRVPVDPGRIVPEGAKSVVAMLNWTTQMPSGKLALRFMENNLPSEGEMELLSESGASRVYVLRVAQAQTDTTYSNRTTWEFHVVPEGEPAAAFEGEFTLVAWASRLEPEAALAQITAPV